WGIGLRAVTEHGRIPSQRFHTSLSLNAAAMNDNHSVPMMQWVPHVPVPVNLRRLFPQASFVGCGDIHCVDVTDRSADCRPQSLFAVIRGARADGHQYIGDALQRGATAL